MQEKPAPSSCPFAKGAAPCPAPQAQTLFEKYAGEKNVPLIVEYFYDELVLKDPLVKDFFSKTNMKKQKIMQGSFVATALGGKKPYTGKNMVAAHQGMLIADKHFDKIIELLGKALAKFGVTEEDIKAVGKALEVYRKDIVNVH